MTYFKNVETLEQLRKAYKDLLKKHHPDNGGSEETMKAINVEYEQLFKILKNRHENKATGTESNTSSYENTKWNFEEDEKLREVLQKIINFEGISIEICGSFIWVSGNTYQYKKAFKELGFMWASTKKMWYYKPETYIKKSRKAVYCKIELPKVANGNWRMLHLQIGESCKAFARSAQERCSA